jgi:hypothetical protein
MFGAVMGALYPVAVLAVFFRPGGAERVDRKPERAINPGGSDRKSEA